MTLDSERYPVRITGTVAGNTFGAFMKYVDECEEVITPRFNGVFNIDSGMVGISGVALPACDVCNGIPESDVSIDCASCGRTRSNYLTIRSGFGDGVYANFDLHWDNAAAGTLVIFDQGNVFANQLAQSVYGIRQGANPLNQPILDVWDVLHASDPNLETHFCGSVTTSHDARWSPADNPYGSLFFGDAGEGLDSLQSVVYNKNMPVDTHNVYAFCERDASNNGILVPRIVVTIRADAAKRLGMPDASNPTTNWPEEVARWNDSMVAGSLAGGALAAAAAENNFFWDLANFQSDEHDELTKKDYEALTYSWLMLQYFQGSLDEQSKQIVYAFSLQVAKTALTIRTMFKTASELTVWPPQAPGGLPKSNVNNKL